MFAGIASLSRLGPPARLHQVTSIRSPADPVTGRVRKIRPIRVQLRCGRTVGTPSIGLLKLAGSLAARGCLLYSTFKKSP